MVQEFASRRSRPTEGQRGTKLFIYLFFFGALIAVHVCVFKYADIIDAESKKYLNYAFGASLYAGIFVGLLFFVAYLIICLSPDKVRRDPELHNVIYFLGFMSTLLSLIVSSYSLAAAPASGTPAAGASQPMELVVQNGLALVATLSGIFFRNLLRYQFPPRPSDLTERWEQLSQVMVLVRSDLELLTEQSRLFSASFSDASSNIQQGIPQWQQFASTAKKIEETLKIASENSSTVNSSIEKSGRVNADLIEVLSRSALAIRSMGEEVERLSRTVSALSAESSDIRSPPRSESSFAGPIGRTRR